jgi:hypothetical protein
MSNPITIHRTLLGDLLFLPYDGEKVTLISIDSFRKRKKRFKIE